MRFLFVADMRFLFVFVFAWYAAAAAAMDATDATDMTNVTDPTNVTDVIDLKEVTNVTEVEDAKDLKDVIDVKDVTNVTEVEDAKDLKDVIDVKDVKDVIDVVTAAVRFACCDTSEHYDEVYCHKCRQYCTGSVVNSGDGDAEMPYYRRCACDLRMLCQGRVGYAVTVPSRRVSDAAELTGDSAESRKDVTERAGDTTKRAGDATESSGDATERARDATGPVRVAWYSRARKVAAGCSTAAIFLAVIVYAGVLEPRDCSNFAKHYAVWLLVAIMLTMTDDQEMTRGLDTELGYLKLFTICMTNNLQIMMSYEVYCFLKSIQEIQTYYNQIFKHTHNLNYHSLCYGEAITVTGICFFIKLNGQHFSSEYFNFNKIEIFNIFYLFPGLINIIFNLVVFYYTSKLKTRFVCNYHLNISRIYNEKLLIRKQLLGLVVMVWLIDVICVIAQFFGRNYYVLQDLKVLQGVGTFIILVFKRNVMEQIKKWILAKTRTHTESPDEL